MASSFTLNTSSYKGRYLSVTCTQTKDIANNKNRIDWTLTSTGGESNYYTTGPTTLEIAGQQAYYIGRKGYSSKEFPAAKGSVSGTVWVDAAANGSCSVWVNLSTAIYTSTVSAVGNTWYLDDIPRAASITSAPNFNGNTDNPTITYSNPAGSAVTVQTGIFDTNGYVCYVGYRNVDVTGSSYTFKLTDAERQNLINAVPAGTNSMYVRFYITTTIGSTVYYSYLTRIVTVKRPATITSAPNFTDEDNPTITYSNPGGNTVDDVQIGIYNSDGSASLVGYRTVDKTGSSYTFELTDEEREKLIASIPNGSNNVYVRFYIKTYVDGSIVDSPRYLTRILTITNATPEISCTVKDIGTGSTALTNDSNVMIPGFNYITASMTSVLKKGATINKKSITNATQTIEGSSANFSSIENGNFTFSLTDSFGQTVTEQKSLTVLPYIKLTCDIKTNNPTADGKTSFKISGNYYNNKFGDNGVNNTLTVKWRIKENNNEYGNWNIVTTTLSGDTYESTVNLTGLDYRKIYTLQAMAIDKVKTGGVQSVERVIKSTPVYNWGENNFDVNVPLCVDDIMTNNIFYGQLEYGTYDSTTGAKNDSPTSDTYRCVDPIEVREGTSYILYVDGLPKKQVILFYDENNSFIGETREVQNDGIFTTPISAKYITFRCFQSDYTTAYSSLKVEIRKASPISDTVGKLKDIIMVNYNKNLAITGTTAVQIPFNIIKSQIGNRLSLDSNGGIVIGPGISYIKANLLVWAEVSGTAYSMINLYVNDTKYAVDIFTKTASGMENWRSQSIPDTLIPVKEGDVIKATINFSAASSSNKIAGTYAGSTNMTVEVLEYSHSGLTYINGDEVRY